MRTTVNIDDELLKRARTIALATRRSLGDVIDDALRMHLVERDVETPGSVQLPTFGGSGLRPGVDLEDRDALAELLDEEPPRAAG